MTLVFLGRVAPEQLRCVRQVADSVVAYSFTLKLDRACYWKRPGISWCGPEETPKQLSQLVRDLQQGLCACGFQPEQRKYKPHVTLARKVKHAEASCLEQAIVWSPGYFVLAGSYSGPEAPRYRVLNQWELA
jgi:2'-5' RNA ligase